MWNAGVYGTRPPSKIGLTKYPKITFFKLLKYWEIAAHNLQPSLSHGLYCTALVKQPYNYHKYFWIQIPCEEKILMTFVCKHRHKHNYRMGSFHLCQKGAYLFDEMCFDLITVEPHDLSCNLTEINNINYLLFLQKLYTVFKLSDTLSQWILDPNCTYIKRSVLGNNNVVIYRADKYTPNITTCSPGQYECNDQSCILDVYVCDGVMDCSRNEDESHCLCYMITNIYDIHFCKLICHPDNCSCMSLYKQLPSGGCLPYHNFNSQYITYNISNSLEEDHKYQHIGNDLYPDIINGIDEEEYKLLLNSKSVNNPSRCNNGDFSCFPGHSRCFKIRHTCLYDLDRQGHILPCRNGAHLQHCGDFPCSNTYKCELSYCIPYRRVCDGHIDCTHGDDEIGCTDYTCRSMLRCRNSSLCVHQVEVCDGVSHCPHGDDESLCGLVPCPIGCQCLALAMQCMQTNMTTIPVTNNLIYILMSGNNISLTNSKAAMMSLSTLEYLNLTRNRIICLCLVGDSLFSSLSRLLHLDLSHNMIQMITNNCFLGLKMLQVLSLQGNFIKIIQNRSFGYLLGLLELNLSNNKINTIRKDGLIDLNNLTTLDLRGNSIKLIDITAINALPKLNILMADAFRVCCISSRTDTICIAPSVLFSSCSNLLHSKLYQGWTIFMAALSTLLNICVLFYGFASGKMNAHKLLVQGLAICDMMYGIYLLIISIFDMLYKGNYATQDWSWRSSVTCHMASLIASVSFSITTIILSYLAIVRHKLVVGMKHYSRKQCLTLLMTFALIVTAINLVPIILDILDGLPQSNSVCLSLITTAEYISVTSIPKIVTYIILLLAMSLIIIIYTKLYWHAHLITENVKSISKTSSNKTKHLSFHILLITITNILCWIPTLVLGILSLFRIEIPGSIITSVAVIIMPLNSAVNPAIFTFATTQFKVIFHKWINRK